MARPLIVIVGETASGKTALAIALARQFNGEIICADSRTVYKGLDIGTAKPTVAEMDGIPHHLLDVAKPDEPFNAATFKHLANKNIDEIIARGKLPFMVGGTGLYVDSVIYDYQFRPPADPVERARLEGLSISELQAEIAQRGLPMPANRLNPRHLTRTLETGEALATKSPLRPDTLLLGLETDRETLNQRIALRVEAMFESGLLDEAQRLFSRYGPDVPALETPGYSALREYLEGRSSLAETKALFIRNDRLLAKRQRTWFKRNKSIHWLPQQGRQPAAAELITTLLNTP